MEGQELDLNESLSTKKREPLPLLPELENIEGVISEVKYQISEFNGEVQYLTKEDGTNILDRNGNPIPRKEFRLTIHLDKFHLNNGKSRQCWVTLGASLSEKAKLPKILNILGYVIPDSIKANDIVNFLVGKQIKFQLVNKQTKKGIFQKVNVDSIRPNIKSNTSGTEFKQSSLDKTSSTVTKIGDIEW